MNAEPAMMRGCVRLVDGPEAVQKACKLALARRVIVVRTVTVTAFKFERHGAQARAKLHAHGGRKRL
jgi:hypothetical protein